MMADILAFVTEPHTLFACAQVNKLWAEESTRILWRCRPPISALENLDNATRIQHYADKIRYLAFRDGHDMQMLPMFSWTRFPGLVSIQVGWGANVRSREEHLMPFLQPSLKLFTANGGIWTQEFLVQIAVSYALFPSSGVCLWRGCLWYINLTIFAETVSKALHI